MGGTRAVEEFFECGEEECDVGLCGGSAHETDAPCLAFEGSEACTDFDVELVEELLADVRLINVGGCVDGVKCGE